MRILVDSSVFIDFTRNNSGNLPAILDLFKTKKASLFVPTVVIAELWSGKSMAEKEEERLVSKILSKFTKIELTEDIAKAVGKLMRNSQVSGAFDAVIASTALNLDAQLATNNSKHFQKIPELKLFKA